MSDECSAFDALKNRMPPKPTQTLGATGIKGTRTKRPRTAQIQMRTKPEIRIAIKKAAVERDTTINRLLEEAFFAFSKETSPSKDTSPVEVAEVQVPSIEATDPRDLNNGLTELMYIFGDEMMREAFPKLAEYENLTVSQLVKALLMEKLLKYEAEGKDVGYKVQR